MIKPGSAPALPDGFKEAHDLKNKELSDSGFVSKDKYFELLAAQRAATKALLDATPEADLDDTRDGKLPPFAPTVGALFTMCRNALAEPFRSVRGVRRMLNETDRVLICGYGPQPRPVDPRAAG